MKLCSPLAEKTVKIYKYTVALIILCLSFSLTLQAKPPIPTPLDLPVIGEIDAFLLGTLYKTQDADAGLENVLKDDRFKKLVQKHDLKLFGGPLLGCVTDRSAVIWVRTVGISNVRAVLSKQGDSSRIVTTSKVKTGPDNDFTALLEIRKLEPNSLYSYDIEVDGKSVFNGKAPAFRTYPSKGRKAKFSVGFGGGARYNPGKEKIWDTIASYSPAAFLFLGDNLYIDLPESRTKQRVHYYRRQLRSEYRRFSSSTSMYAIYDDHDFGKNDCAGGPDPFKPEWKPKVWNVFKENWNNPYYGGGDNQPGCWHDFSIGDVDFFMLDNRYYRSFKDGTMLGSAQKKWLLSKLKESKGIFKVIASGTLWTEHADKGGKDSWWGVKKEREEIFSFIEKNKIGGVILLSADRHRTDVYRIKRLNGYDLYEFETSKLTNDHKHPTKKKALFSYNKGNFFGLLSFDLKKDDPEVTFQCITSEKKSVYELTLKRSQLTSLPKPPYHGTIWIDPDIITDKDKTVFKRLVEAGKGERTMFDNRVRKWVKLKPWLFNAEFTAGRKSIEVQVNPEFDKKTAHQEALTYSKVIGQLPVCLRKDVDTVWIHKGNSDFGGGNKNLLIHVDRGTNYVARGILAETLMHEATHTSIDGDHKKSKGWLNAQNMDNSFISAYAQTHPGREDLAESFLPWFAYRYKPHKIESSYKRNIEATMRQRMAYLDSLKLDMYPVQEYER